MKPGLAHWDPTAVVVVVYSAGIHYHYRVTGHNIPSATGRAGKMAEVPTATLRPCCQMNDKRLRERFKLVSAAAHT